MLGASYFAAMDHYMNYRKSDALAAFLLPMMLASTKDTSLVGSTSTVQAPDGGVEEEGDGGPE